MKDQGHTVDILITSKDVLEELVKNEGWQYTNIFPEGRKFKNISPYISSAINFLGQFIDYGNMLITKNLIYI